MKTYKNYRTDLLPGLALSQVPTDAQTRDTFLRIVTDLSRDHGFELVQATDVPAGVLLITAQVVEA